MHLQRIFLLGLIALLIGSGTAFAAITGVIAGKATDVDGNAIPGVTVSVYGANLPGVRMDTTSSSGTYRMPELPPGIYTVKAELMGMKTIERPNIKVSLNSTTKINVTMEMAPFEETVVVTGSSPVLDVKSTTVKATIERDVTERLPGSDSLFAAFSMSGGITGGGNVRVHGGAFTDNVYLFDGLDTTDPLTSTFGANLNADALQEVEVQTGGFTAEYGRSMGGIVNAVTRSGGNDLHVIWREKYVDGTWHDSPDEGKEISFSDSEYWEHTLTADGPFVKDKLWWMFSVRYSNNEGNTSTVRGFGYDYTQPGGSARVKADREWLLPYAKLTYQINQDHKIMVNYSGEDATIYGSNAGQYTAPEALNMQEQGGPFYALEYTWLVNREFYLIFRGGVSLGYLNNVPVNDNGEPAFRDEESSVNYNNSGSFTEENRIKHQLSLIGNYFVDEAMGSHEFKAGFEKHYLKHEDTAGFPGGASYSIRYSDRTTADRTVPMSMIDPDHATTADASGHYFAVFVQDDWSVLDNVTLNLGIRYERAWFKNNDGKTDVPAWAWGQWHAEDYFTLAEDGETRLYQEAPMEFDNMIAPRLGVSWDIFGDGKLAATAYIGRFYNAFNLILPQLMFQPFSADTNASAQQEYTAGDEHPWTDNDGDGVPDDDGYFYDDDNWYTHTQSEPGDTNFIDAEIDPEYTDEISFGLQWEFIDDFSVGYQYTDRTTKNIVEDVGIFTDEDGNVVWTYLGGINREDPDNWFFAGDSDDFYDRDPLFDGKYDRDDDPDTNNEYYKHHYWVTNARGERNYWGHEINAVARLKHFDVQASYTYSKAEGVVIDTQDNGGVTSGGVTQFSGQFDTWGTTKNLYGELPWSCRHYIKLAATAHYMFFDIWDASIGVNSFWRSGYHFSKLTNPDDTYDPYEGNDRDDRSTWTGKPPYSGYKWTFMEPRGQNELPSYKNVDLSIQNTLDTKKWFGKYGPAFTAIFDIFNLLDYQGITSKTATWNKNNDGAGWGLPNGYGQPRNYRLTLKLSI